MTQKHAVQITYEDAGQNGRFVARIHGVEDEGELIVSRVSETLVNAEHTFAPDALRGTGAAAAMVEALIADARAKGYRVVPVCPYVQAQVKKHPEWSDVIQS